ncbi:hypothetical protein BJX70DRAFT_397240 [Aspergillus crustosus]
MPSSLTGTAAQYGSRDWGRAMTNTSCPNGHRVVTGFTPSDNAFRFLAARQARLRAEQYQYQSSDQLLTAATLRAYTGSIVQPLNIYADLGGPGQVVLTRGQRDGDTCGGSPGPIRLYSGLGNEATIVEEDIPFDGGILHIITGY